MAHWLTARSRSPILGSQAAQMALLWFIIGVFLVALLMMLGGYFNGFRKTKDR